MFGQVTHRLLRIVVRQLGVQFARHVHLFVLLVFHAGQRVGKAAGTYQLGHDDETARPLVDEAVDHIAQRLVAGGNDALHLVDETIDGLDVAIGLRHGIYAVNEDAVRVVAVVHRQLTFVHVTDQELFVLVGER